MRTRIQPIIGTPDAAAMAEEVRRVFQELDQSAGADPLAGECSPPLDVRETDDAVEITMDLPDVPASAVRVVVKGNLVLIAGRKTPRRWQGDSSFHLVERDFGRFARTIRVSLACDAGRARARLAGGELTVTLPRVADRWGRPIEIRVEPAPEGPAQ